MFKGWLGNAILNLLPNVKERLNMESMVLFCHSCHELDIDEPDIWTTRQIQEHINDNAIPQAIGMKGEFGALRFFIRWFGIGWFDNAMVKNCTMIYNITKKMLENLNPGMRITQMKVARQFNPERLKEKSI